MCSAIRFYLVVDIHLQVACGDHLSKGVLATMTTWHTGFKLATENGIAEALVELTLDRQNLQVSSTSKDCCVTTVVWDYCNYSLLTENSAQFYSNLR